MFSRLLSSAFIAGSLLVGLMAEVNALELKPLYANLKPAGAAAEQVFRVTNTQDKPVAVQFKMTTREQRADGSENQAAADDLFMVYPPQAVIPANQTQKVRVQWLGEQTPHKELAYRLIAEQVAVKLEKAEKTNVQMVMTLVGSVYITPDNIAEDLKVEQLQSTGNQLKFRVSNQGTKHAMLNNLSIELSNGNESLKLSGAQVNGANGKNILAGASRDFTIPNPVGIAIDANWQATLNYTK
ncbi:MAG: fimbrial biogenesis chaperone [bacterium]